MNAFGVRDHSPMAPFLAGINVDVKLSVAGKVGKPESFCEKLLQHSESIKLCLRWLGK